MKNEANVEFKVNVSGDLCHRSGYVQNDSVKNLIFARSTSRAVQLVPGAYSLTIFVGAEFGRTNVDYAVELVIDPTVPSHVSGCNPIRARTVGSTGFVVIDFALS
jgi:hypothetical protein